MRIAILSDIHANASALNAVLRSSHCLSADVLMIAGDFVGYYFEPKAVLQLLKSYKKTIFMVRGNHEEKLFRAKKSVKELEKISSKYGPGIQIALEQLTDSEVSWLARLPHPLEINKFEYSILLSHGSPLNIDQYVYPNNSVQDILQSLSKIPDVLIMGHTHYPLVEKVDGCLVINPGSVGQPRNRIPGAHWALLDTSTMSVDSFVEPYDLFVLQQSCLKIAPEFPYLCEVLTRL